MNGERQLGLASLLALGLNGIIGVGIFFAPSEVAARVPGNSGLAVYAVTALCLMPIAWTYATLGGRFDRDGGPYVWARAAFGPKLAFAVGWIAYVSALFSTSAVMVGFAQHVAPLFGLDGPWGQRIFGILILLILSTVAGIGLRPSAAAWDAVTVLKLLPLIALIGAFFWMKPTSPEVSTSGVRFDAFQRAMLVVVFALQGFEIVPVPAGHARNVRHAVPIATIGALAGAAIVYILIHAACVSALSDLPKSRAPLVDAGRALAGARLESIMEIGTNVSALGIALGMLAMSPRYLSALGTSDALGSWLSVEDARRVPQRALWITVGSVLVLTQWAKLGELFALSSVAVLAQYGVTAAALARLAFAKLHGLRPWHALPAPFALASILLIAQGATALELLVEAVVLSLGVALLIFRSRSRRAAPAR